MTRRLHSAVLGLVAAGLAWAGQAQTVAIVDVALVPLDSARVVPHQTVVVVGDRISAVGPAGAVPVPDGADVVDGRGRFLMPGLADMHAHLAHPETGYYAEDNRASAALLLAHGVTTARVMWGTPGVLAFADSLRDGRILGPRVTVASPFLQARGDTAGVWSPDAIQDPAIWRVRTEADGRASVRHASALGYDYVKVYDQIPAPAYEGVLAEAERLGLAVVGHVPGAVGLARVLADGRQRSIEHVSVFRGLAERLDSPARDSTAWYHRYFGSFAHASPERMDVMAAFVAAEGVWIVPTVLTTEWYSGPQPDMLARLAMPDLLRYTAPAQRSIWRAYAEGWATNYAQWGLDMTAERAFALEAVGALHRRGARLMLGTDATPAMSVQGLAVHEGPSGPRRACRRLTCCVRPRSNPPATSGRSGWRRGPPVSPSGRRRTSSCSAPILWRTSRTPSTSTPWSLAGACSAGLRWTRCSPTSKRSMLTPHDGRAFAQAPPDRPRHCRRGGRLRRPRAALHRRH